MPAVASPIWKVCVAAAMVSQHRIPVRRSQVKPCRWDQDALWRPSWPAAVGEELEPRARDIEDQAVVPISVPTRPGAGGGASCSSSVAVRHSRPELSRPQPDRRQPNDQRSGRGHRLFYVAITRAQRGRLASAIPQTSGQLAAPPLALPRRPRSATAPLERWRIHSRAVARPGSPRRTDQSRAAVRNQRKFSYDPAASAPDTSYSRLDALHRLNFVASFVLSLSRSKARVAQW